MPRKSVKLSAPVADPPKPVVPAPPPKTEVQIEGKRDDDGDTLNELVVQKVSIPSTSKIKGKPKTEFKKYLRIFVRPDESHNEPDSRCDDHEPEDEAALKRLFATHGDGSGSEIRVRMNVTSTGDEEFFLDVWYPKKDDGDEDAKFAAVLIDPKSPIADIVSDLLYAMSDQDPPDDFATRGAMEDLVEELKGDVEELEPVRSVLDEFDMPGDLPSNLYSLPERLRSIFRAAKGLGK
jgi:hypothetical protein